MTNLDTSDVSASAASSSDPFLPTQFLVFGGGPVNLPGARFHSNPSHPYAAIVLAGPVDPAELNDVLDQSRDPAAPIADFGGNRGVRRDFTGHALDADSLAAMQRKLAPIWRRLTELPFRARHDERADIVVLRLAYSRDTAIEARFSTDTVIEYPLQGRAPGLRRRLENLADLGALRRRHFARTHLCGRCNSARLLAYEACPKCGSADLTDEPIVHHYRCGCQEPESRFIAGRLLICPKCRRELRHFGVDYSKPGSVVQCRACGAANAEPDPQFACLDCAAVTPARVATVTDWYHYNLTTEGMEALQTGTLGRQSAPPAFVAGNTRACSPVEFQLLAAEQLHVAHRSNRPFTVAELGIGDPDMLRNTYGPASVDTALRRMAEVIGATLSEGEFLAPTTTSILVGLPETTASEAAQVMDRMRLAISNAVPMPIDLVTKVREGDTATEFLRAS